eukprot:493457-Hanusia_phi.AAC.1
MPSWPPLRVLPGSCQPVSYRGDRGRRAGSRLGRSCRRAGYPKGGGRGDLRHWSRARADTKGMAAWWASLLRRYGSCSTSVGGRGGSRPDKLRRVLVESHTV